MHKALIILFSLFALMLLVSGCSKTKENVQGGRADNTNTLPQIKAISETARENCINLCKQEKDAGKNLEIGPCLSDKIIDDWVCDVAHNPRQAVDNMPENQCDTFRNGQAHHFVEVDVDCKTITVY